MSQGHFPGVGNGAAADEGNVAHGVVRGTKGTSSDEPLIPPNEPLDAVNLGGLQALLGGHGGKNGVKAPGQHGFA